jgi:hypothetical protein
MNWDVFCTSWHCFFFVCVCVCVCVCNKHSDNLTVASVTIYIILLHHYEYPLMFPWDWVVLWQSLHHSSLSFHKFSSWICVQSLPTLFYMSFLTCSVHLFLGLLNSCLFSILIFGALKGILLLYMYNTCPYHCIRNLINYSSDFQKSTPTFCCGREAVSEVGDCWTEWSKVKIQFLELP